MPNVLTLPVNAGTLPAGQCPQTLQALAELFASIYNVQFPLGTTGVTLIASAAPPGSQFQTSSFAWLQLDDLLRPVRLYFFYQNWLSRHPLVPGHVMIWTQPLPNFATFDGGDSNAVTSDTTGPMWEEVTDLRAKFPIGAGTLPASPAGTGATLSVGDSGGEQIHTLTVAEGAMDPHHNHLTGKFNSAEATWLISESPAPAPNLAFHAYLNEGLGNGQVAGTIGANSPITGTFAPTGPWTNTSGVLPDPGNPNAIQPHQNMPPYFTVYFLRRTARLFYAV